MKLLGMEVVTSTTMPPSTIMLLPKFDWQRRVDEHGRLLAEEVLVERKHCLLLTGLTVPTVDATVASS